MNSKKSYRNQFTEYLQKSYTDTSGRTWRVPAKILSAMQGVIARSLEGADGARVVEPAQIVEGVARHIDIVVNTNEPVQLYAARLCLQDGADVKIEICDASVPRVLLQADLPFGIHMLTGVLRFASRDVRFKQAIICAPRHCQQVSSEEQAKVLAIQLYALRSQRNWGIGDFTDLRNVISVSVRQGYRYVALNPLHRLSYSPANIVSPYSADSRELLNWIYLDLELVPGFAEYWMEIGAAGRQKIAQSIEDVRATLFVDYENIIELKLPILQLLAERAWRILDRGGQSEGAQWAEFHEFIGRFGTAIRKYTALRVPDADASALQAAYEFDLFVEWCCRKQLAECARCEHGIGLIMDLAIGADSNSVEIKAMGELAVREASIGAAPDSFNWAGQNWNLTPINPVALRNDHYSFIVRILEKNMPENGGVRIDHVMWMCRQYWILRGHEARDGTYIKFPEKELIAIVRALSARHRCIVIGEDLGTVPRGFRARLSEAGIYTMHVVRFERKKDGHFRSFSKYRRNSCLYFSTHDLAPLAAYFNCEDIELAVSCRLMKPGQKAQAKRARQLEILKLQEVLPSTADAGGRTQFRKLYNCLRLQARQSPCHLIVDLFDDVLGETLPVNIPGTTDEYPNWRRKYSAEMSPDSFSQLAS